MAHSSKLKADDLGQAMGSSQRGKEWGRGQRESAFGARQSSKVWAVRYRELAESRRRERQGCRQGVIASTHITNQTNNLPLT